MAEAVRARPIDGVDISREMLGQAGEKGVYRNLIEADLTKRLPMEDAVYDAVISAGTFTEGHVGPEALPELVRVAAPGARFVLGVNHKVFEELDFAGAFDALAADGRITPPIYRQGEMFAADAAHSDAGKPFSAALFQRKPDDTP